jgi:hypothetical protein
MTGSRTRRRRWRTALAITPVPYAASSTSRPVDTDTPAASTGRPSRPGRPADPPQARPLARRRARRGRRQQRSTKIRTRARLGSRRSIRCRNRHDHPSGPCPTHYPIIRTSSPRRAVPADLADALTFSTPCRRPPQGAVIDPCDDQFSYPPFPAPPGAVPLATLILRLYPIPAAGRGSSQTR